jgi:hypothetical protein
MVMKYFVAALVGMMLISMAQTNATRNTETPGASKDFAESAERGWRDKEYRDSQMYKNP